MAIGKFMCINGVVTAGGLYLLTEALPGSAAPAFIALAYFWGSLWLYTSWFRDEAQVDKLSDADLHALKDEWTSHGPFGRNTPELRRADRSGDPRRQQRALSRIIDIYEEQLYRSKDEREKAELSRKILDSKRLLEIRRTEAQNQRQKI